MRQRRIVGGKLEFDEVGLREDVERRYTTGYVTKFRRTRVIRVEQSVRRKRSVRKRMELGEMREYVAAYNQVDDDERE